MSNINDHFPSKYLQASDLKGRDFTLHLGSVNSERMQNGDLKAVVYFRETEKGLVLNVTNKNRIVSLYGEETDSWSGKPVTLFPTMTEFSGEEVQCIRIRPNSASPAAQTAQAPSPTAAFAERVADELAAPAMPNYQPSAPNTMETQPPPPAAAPQAAPDPQAPIGDESVGDVLDDEIPFN